MSNFPVYEVRVVKLPAPVGNVEHALVKCPRCLKGIGVTPAMLEGIDSIICRGDLGNTGMECRGHYYFNKLDSTIKFVGTIN